MCHVTLDTAERPLTSAVMVVLSTNFHIPAGQAISIKLIHLSTLSGIPFSALFAPPLDGHDPCRKSPSLSFLLEHPSGQKLLFDLGIRKDHENYAPVVEKRNTRRSLTIDVEKNVIELLQEHGLKGEDINGIVLRYCIKYLLHMHGRRCRLSSPFS